MRLQGVWKNTENISAINYKCGFCGTVTAPYGGYSCIQRTIRDGEITAYILICTTCNKPTYYTLGLFKEQVPGPAIGEKIGYLPDDLDSLYNEIRNCLSVGSYTASVLLARKMLMNIAVSEGAKENMSFYDYITYLEDHGFITNKMKPWVDYIRKIGNVATHEIPDISKDDALKTLEFTSMLLKLVYEFPNKMQEQTNELR